MNSYAILTQLWELAREGSDEKRALGHVIDLIHSLEMDKTSHNDTTYIVLGWVKMEVIEELGLLK